MKKRKELSSKQLYLGIGWLTIFVVFMIGVALMRGDAWELFLTVLMFLCGAMIVGWGQAAKTAQQKELSLAMLLKRQIEKQAANGVPERLN